MLNCAAGEGSLACQGSAAVQTEMHQGLGEPVVLSIRAPWAASTLHGYRKVAWQNQENQAALGGIPTWIALGNSPDLTDLLQFRSVWS